MRIVIRIVRIIIPNILDLQVRPAGPARAGTHDRRFIQPPDPNTGTSLFDIDIALDQVVLQSPPNAGSLAATGKTTVDGKTDVGFDVHSSAVNARVQSNLGFAVVASGGVSRFYSVNLLTGRLTFMGRFATEVTDSGTAR